MPIRNACMPRASWCPAIRRRRGVAYGRYGGGGGGPDPALVRAVQSELVRLSYLQDTPDGVMGGHTRSAIGNYERANGLAVDCHGIAEAVGEAAGNADRRRGGDRIGAVRLGRARATRQGRSRLGHGARRAFQLGRAGKDTLRTQGNA